MYPATRFASATSVSRLCLYLFIAVGLFAPTARSQHRLSIADPYGASDRLNVLALEGSRSVVNSGYGVESVQAGRYFFDEGESYADGYLEINDPEGYVLKDDDRSRFQFSVRVKASQEYTDCFLVLRLYTQDGREYLLPYELEDLKPGKAQQLHVKPELGVELGRGIFYYHFFSQGEEIYYAMTRRDLAKRNPRKIALEVEGSRDPDIVSTPENPLPGELRSLVSGHEALIAVGVNDSGFSVDHLVVDAPDPTTSRLAMDIVKNARFTPATREGYYVRQDLLLRVSFDARGDYTLNLE